MKLFIIGCGDIGKFVAYNFYFFNTTGLEIAGFLDDDTEKWGKSIGGYPVIGGVNLIHQQKEQIAVLVSIGDPKTKKKIIQDIHSEKVIYPSLIAPNAWISKEVTIGNGVIVYPGVSINYQTLIEDHAIINMNCSIGHNCTISKYTTLAPGVSLGGFSFVEECVSIGINAATKQSIRIGKNSIVGGMSMVVKDLPADVTVVGVPARIIKNKNS